MDILGYVFLALFFFIYPLTACIVFDRYKTRFNVFTALIAVALYSLVSYVTVNGFIFLRYFLDPMSLRGPELAIALFFGWLYLSIRYSSSSPTERKKTVRPQPTDRSRFAKRRGNKIVKDL